MTAAGSLSLDPHLRENAAEIAFRKSRTNAVFETSDQWT